MACLVIYTCMFGFGVSLTKSWHSTVILVNATLWKYNKITVSLWFCEIHCDSKHTLCCFGICVESTDNLLVVIKERARKHTLSPELQDKSSNRPFCFLAEVLLQQENKTPQECDCSVHYPCRGSDHGSSKL